MDFQYIEQLLMKLLMLLTGVFSESEKNEVQEFIDVGEYGLALETLVDIIDEEDKLVEHDVQKLLIQAASAMSLDKEVFLGKLDRHIEV